MKERLILKDMLDSIDDFYVENSIIRKNFSKNIRSKSSSVI